MPIAKDIVDRTLATPHGEQGYRIVEKLHDAGFDAWWVGGGVRDMLIGDIPDDIDIASNATPDEVTELFPKCDLTSAALGSVLISQSGHVFEHTTFREDDSASDGRHPESVHFGTREQDAARRDFTINTMYWQPISGELYDPYEGEKDLSERLIHFVGDPHVRIDHDALRILRAVRLRALISGQYHPDTFHAMHELAKNVSVLSGSRRLTELEKILNNPNASVALEDLWETDILEYMIPELYKCKGVAQPADYHKEGDVWNHTMQCISSYTDDHGCDVRIAALFHDIGKAETFAMTDERIRFDEHATVSSDITKKILDRLQCPGSRRDKICWLIAHHMMMGSFADMSDVRKAHWYYHPWFTELLQLFWLDVSGTTPSNFDLYEEIVSDYNTYLDEHPLPPKPLLNGEDVMAALGLQPGEKVGEVLKLLYDAQLEKKIRSKAEAQAFLETLKQ